MKHEKINNEEILNVIAIFFIFLFLVIKNIILIYATIIILLTGTLVKPLGRVIAGTWIKIITVIGTFNSKIILALLFYFILTPLALMRRLQQNNLLWLSKPDIRSYWKDINKNIQKKDMEKLW